MKHGLTETGERKNIDHAHSWVPSLIAAAPALYPSRGPGVLAVLTARWYLPVQGVSKKPWPLVDPSPIIM